MMVYIVVNVEQYRDNTPAGARAIWLKDLLLAPASACKDMLTAIEERPSAPASLTDIINFNQKERTLPKPSYTFNRKASFKMKHDVVINPNAVVIDEIEVISSKNNVSYGVFIFLAGVFLEDQHAGKKRDDYRAIPVQKIQINGKEYSDSTSMRKNINRLRKELAGKLSEEFKVPFDDNEIIENPKGQTGYRLNPNRVTVCMETPEPK